MKLPLEKSRPLGSKNKNQKGDMLADYMYQKKKKAESSGKTIVNKKPGDMLSDYAYQKRKKAELSKQKSTIALPIEKSDYMRTSKTGKVVNVHDKRTKKVKPQISKQNVVNNNTNNVVKKQKITVSDILNDEMASLLLNTASPEQEQNVKSKLLKIGMPQEDYDSFINDAEIEVLYNFLESKGVSGQKIESFLSEHGVG